MHSEQRQASNRWRRSMCDSSARAIADAAHSTNPPPPPLLRYTPTHHKFILMHKHIHTDPPLVPSSESPAVPPSDASRVTRSCHLPGGSTHRFSSLAGGTRLHFNNKYSKINCTSTILQPAHKCLMRTATIHYVY